MPINNARLERGGGLFTGEAREWVEVFHDMPLLKAIILSKKASASLVIVAIFARNTGLDKLA